MEWIINNGDFFKMAIKLFSHYHDVNIRVDKNDIYFYKSDGISMTIVNINKNFFGVNKFPESIKEAQIRTDEFLNILNCFNGVIILSFDDNFTTLLIKTSGDTIIKKEFKIRLLELSDMEIKLRELNYENDYYIYKISSIDFGDILHSPDKKEEKISFNIDGKELHTTSQQESSFLLQYFTSIEKSDKLSIETIGKPNIFKIVFGKEQINKFMNGLSGTLNLEIMFKEAYPIIIKSEVFDGITPMFKFTYFLAPRVDID